MKHSGYFANVGNTPLVKISKQLYAKLETYNPTGSIKDRMIAYVVKRAQERGEFGEKPRLCGRLLHYTNAQAQQVIKHVAERVIIFKNRVGITTRRRRQR